MISRSTVAAVTLALAGTALAQEVYVVDPVHSQPLWEARHIGMALQHGIFAKSTGKITLDRAAGTGTVEFEIDAASIQSHDTRVDPILKGDRFFNVEKFPTITFRSTKVVFQQDRVASVDGELTMVGVTKPVTLQVERFNCGENVFNKKPMCAADASAVIKRSDWGLTTGLNVGNPADEIRLRLPIEAYKQ